MPLTKEMNPITRKKMTKCSQVVEVLAKNTTLLSQKNAVKKKRDILHMLLMMTFFYLTKI